MASEIVALIQNGSQDLAQLRSALQQREDQLIQMLPELDTAAQALTPSQHTLGLVFLLHCKAAAVPLSQPQAVHVFLDQCRRMLLGADATQVQMVASQCACLTLLFASPASTLLLPAH